MSRKNDPMKIEIPDVVMDPNTGRKYKKGKFLGRGGFAKCFELIDCTTGTVFAGKVISKAQLQKTEQKEKMSQEISIHRSIKNKHIVEFYSYFEDKEHIYIILEICNKRSLMEMHKRRKVITEPEVRYFTRQIAEGCKFLHDNRIVHRDLKLGNLFINDYMEVKVGDFGLATRIGSHGERKMTLCGTPNYIAPEVLTKKGHSYEVDVWSLGCIVYTLLVGKPPFETNDLKETYRKIRHNDYTIPSHIPREAKIFIDKMLQSCPEKRPTMQQILDDGYLQRSYVPSRLPTSCLTTAPRFDQGRLSIMPTEYPSSPLVARRPLVAQDMNNAANSPRQAVVVKPQSAIRQMKGGDEKPSIASRALATLNPNKNVAVNAQNQECKSNLHELKVLLDNLLKHPELRSVDDMGFESQDPAASPIFWVSKWVDYTDKYGIGYQLCDNSTGVVFNDQTRLVLMSDEQTLQYVDRTGAEQFLNYNTNERAMYKKVTLLKYFKNYMNEHLLKTGDKASDADNIARLPYLKSWFRTKHAIVFYLTNGSLQINFFQDHTKLILCPLMGAVTYVDENREFTTYRFSLVTRYGISRELTRRMKYASEVVNRLVAL